MKKQNATNEQFDVFRKSAGTSLVSVVGKLFKMDLFGSIIARNAALYGRQNIQTFSIEQIAQPAFTCLKLTVETLEQSVKYVQS